MFPTHSNRLETYNRLHETTNRPSAPQLSLFAPVAPITQKNTNEFWYASDIYNIAEARTNFPTIKTLPNFTTPVADLFNHVIPTEHRHTIGYKNFNKDYKLSRFACWKLLNEEKYDTFFTTYFMMPNAQFHEIEKIADDFLRVRFRNHVRNLMNQLNGMIKKSGDNYEEVKNSFYQDLFNIKYNTQEIKSAYQIPAGISLLDYMGLDALQMTYKILNTTEKRFNNLDRWQTGVTKALLHEETIRAREDAEKQNCVLPERNIEHTVVQILNRQLKSITNEFIRKYQNEHIK